VIGIAANRAGLIGLLSFLAGVAFWPGIPGAAMTPRWVIWVVALPLLVQAVEVTLGHLVLLALLLWSAVSLAWHPLPIDGADALIMLAVVVALVWVGSSLDDLRMPLAGFAAAMAVNGALAVAQEFGFSGVYQVWGPAGLFLNANALGEIAALAFVGCAALGGNRIGPWSIAAAAALIPLILAGSRGAWLAALVGLAFVMLRGRVVAIAAAVVTVALFLAWMQFDWHWQHQAHRVSLWLDTLDGLTFFGHGIGSWYGLYPLTATRTDSLLMREAHAHNDFLELWFDLGTPGIVMLCIFGCVALRGSDRAARAILAAFVMEALVAFPLHLPCTAVLAALAAGRLIRGGDRLCQRVADRRVEFSSGYAPG
jgi:hypothetical protein